VIDASFGGALKPAPEAYQRAIDAFACKAEEIVFVDDQHRNVVTRLTDLGLVSVRQDPDDKRRVLVSLTDRGSEIIGATLPSALKAEEETLGVLSNAERKTLDDILTKLLVADT